MESLQASKSLSKRPRAILAEDEPLLRQQLRRRLSVIWPELEIVAETDCGEDTIRFSRSHRPDLLFLDIRMPNKTGIDVARELHGMCHVVFVTAYDEYAIEAFEHGAVDYVLKPVTEERLAATVERLKDRLFAPPVDLEALLAGLAQKISPPGEKSHLRWITASMGATTRLIAVDDVCYFQSAEKYTRVVTQEAEALIRKPIRELIGELDPQHFWQIHRATVVNVRAIAAVGRDFRGQPEVRLKTRGDKLPVSRAFAHLFRQM